MALDSLSNPNSALVTSNHRMSFFGYRLTKLRQIMYAKKTNSPFLSGDSFASVVDYYVYGRSGREPVDPLRLAEARSIFVDADRLLALLDEHFGVIKSKVLVTGNSDTNWDHLPKLPDSVSLWLAQNSSITNPLVRTLPIGIENFRLGGRGLPRYYSESSRPRVEAEVLVPPMSNSNAVRPAAVAEALGRPEVFRVMTSYMPSARYLKLAKRFRFVLCLEGNGYENHRVWETLYFGNFPVLLSTPWSRTLEYLGLPILLVEKLADVTSELLESFARQHKDFDPAAAEPLWIPYWKAIIDSHVTRSSS